MCVVVVAVVASFVPFGLSRALIFYQVKRQPVRLLLVSILSYPTPLVLPQIPFNSPEYTHKPISKTLYVTLHSTLSQFFVFVMQLKKRTKLSYSCTFTTNLIQVFMVLFSIKATRSPTNKPLFSYATCTWFFSSYLSRDKNTTTIVSLFCSLSLVQIVSVKLLPHLFVYFTFAAAAAASYHNTISY